MRLFWKLYYKFKSTSHMNKLDILIRHCRLNGLSWTTLPTANIMVEEILGVPTVIIPEQK